MRAAFPEPVLTITPAAVRDLQGREALSGLWTLFTKCKESLQDGRRLENISWRLWYREIMRDGASPSSSASPSPSISRTGSSEQLHEEKAEKKVNEMDSKKGSEKNVDGSQLVSPQSAAAFALFASARQQHPPISTPHSPPPAYALGFDFIPNDRDEQASVSTDTVSRKGHAHPLTPSASQTSVSTDSEAGQVNQAMIVPSPAQSSIPRAPSIPQPSREFNPSSSASVEPSIPITLSQSRPTEKRPTFPTESSTSSVLSTTSATSASTSSNSKPRRPSHRRRRSSFVNGAEEEPVNVGLIICEMLPSAGLESSEKTQKHIPFPSPSLSHSSHASSPVSSVTSWNLQNTPTLAVNIFDIDQQPLGSSSSSTPTTAATVVGVGLAFADLARAAASTLPTPEIEVGEEDALPAPPRVGGARYPLVVPSPQTSPPRPHAHQQQHQSQSGSAPPVIPPIIVPGGVQPPQLVIVTPTPGATPHPTPPATPLVGWGMGRYGQYLIVPKSSSQGRSKTRGGDEERDDNGDYDDGSTEGDEDEDGSEDYTDSDDGDYEDVDEEEQEEQIATKSASISDTPVATTRSNASPPLVQTGLVYSAIGGGDSQKRVSISSAISDRSTTSNASSNTTHTTSSAETRDTEASLQPTESKRDKGKQKDLTPPDDEWEEQYEDVDDDEYNSHSYEDLDDEEAIMEQPGAAYERSLQRGNADAMTHMLEPATTGSDGPSSAATTMKANVTKSSSALSSAYQQQQEKASHEQPQVQPSNPLLSMHTNRRSPVITARSSKGLRGGFTAGKGKSMSRSRSRNRDEVLKLTGALVMTESATVITSPLQEIALGGPVSAAKIPTVDAAPTPVVVSQPVKALPPPPLPVVLAAVAPLGAQVAVSPPPPSPTYSIQSTSSSGRGRSRNIVAIGRGMGGNGGKGKRRGGLVALKRRLSSDARKGDSNLKDDNRDGEGAEEEGGSVSVSDMGGGENETSIEMDAHDMLDEEVNPQAKVEQSDSPAATQQPNPDVDNQASVRTIDPVQVQAHIKAQVQAEIPLQVEPVSTTEHRAPVRFNIGSNSEDGTGSASASGSTSVGRSGSTGFRSGSGSGSRTRGGVLRKRLEKARARAVSRSVEEEKETVEEYGRKSVERGGDVEVQEVAAVQEAQLQAVRTQSPSRTVEDQKPTQPTVRPLLQPMGNRKGDRQLEELLKMEQRTHQLASRQVSTVAVGGGLPPVIAPLAPSPRLNARSPSQGRGKSPRTKSAITQRASTTRSSGSTSKNLQDPQLMKVLNHVMDLPSNGNRQKKVVLATSESEEDDDDDYETETDVDQAGLVAALSPRQQRAFADHMAATQAAPEVVQDQQQNDDDDWSSATDDMDDDASPPSQARPHASQSRQHVPQQPPVRPPPVQRTYSSHYPAGRTGRVVKQQLVEQQRQQQLLLQQQQQQNQRRGKQQRDSIEINRLPSESFQNLALAKLRNDSIGGLTRLLNPGLNEQELLSTVQRGYSSGDILRDSPTQMRRMPTGGTIGGLHGLRPLTSAHPSLARMPLMQPPFAPMAAPPPNWNPVAEPRIQMSIPHLDRDHTTGRPPLVRRHTENALGPATDVAQPVETSVPAPNVVPTPVVAPGPVVPDVPNSTVVPPAAAPAMSTSRSVAAIRPQPHRRQSSSSSTATALRPNGLLTKLTLNKSFIAPASTTVTVNSLASDRASPAEINPKSGNSLYSKVPPDATSRIRALNALVNSRKATPVAKSPPTASPIATSSSAPADAVLAAVAPLQSPLSPSPAPSVPTTAHESITAPNGANVAVGLDGYGGAGRYQKKGPPADVELETEEEDEDGMYEDESSDHSDSVAEGTFQTERQKQIAASLACSLSANPVLDEPPPKPPVNPKAKGVAKGMQTQPQRSAQGKVASGGRRGGKSAEREKAVRDSRVNAAGGPAAPETAQQALPKGGAATSGEGPQQRRPPKTLQFTQMSPSEQPPTRQASRQALQLEQSGRHPVQPLHDGVQGHPQQLPSGPQQQYAQLQQQQLELQRQLQQLEQQQIQQQLLQQQQLQYHQQQQYLLNAQQQQQQFAYQPPGQGQFVYPHQHQQHPQHPPHLYQQGGPGNHPNYAPIPYTQSQQHFPTASLQKLGFPYNLPVTAIPSSPRTTRRIMVKDELSESVRQGVVIGRKITRLNPGRQTSMGEDAEWRRRPLTAAPSMVQLLPKGTLKAMGVEDDEPGASKRKGTAAEPDPAMRRALQHSRNKSWADTTHTSGW